MTDLEEETIARNRAQQTAWYGEPLGDAVRRVTGALRLTQAELAGIIGLSPPMLSQLASARRAKIANPSVLARLQSLTELATSPSLATLTPEEVARRLREVRERADTGVLTATGSGGQPRGAEAVTLLLQALVGPTAGPGLVAALDAGSGPGVDALATLLRVYLLGPADAASGHYRDVTGA